MFHLTPSGNPLPRQWLSLLSLDTEVPDGVPVPAAAIVLLAPGESHCPGWPSWAGKDLGSRDSVDTPNQPSPSLSLEVPLLGKIKFLIFKASLSWGFWYLSWQNTLPLHAAASLWGHLAWWDVACDAKNSCPLTDAEFSTVLWPFAAPLLHPPFLWLLTQHSLRLDVFLVWFPRKGRPNTLTGKGANVSVVPSSLLKKQFRVLMCILWDAQTESCLWQTPLWNSPLYLGERKPNMKLLGYWPFLVQPIVLSFHHTYYPLLRAGTAQERAMRQQMWQDGAWPHWACCSVGDGSQETSSCYQAGEGQVTMIAELKGQ